jgi:drug/metabolite transporter (DMT)-like permease
VRGVFAAFLCTILFSLSVVCGHRSARQLGGTEANFWRLVFATLFLGLWAFGFGFGLSGKAFPVFFLSGMIGIGIGDVAFFQALPRLGSRLSLLLVECLSAPFGALLEWLWLGTTLSARQIAWGLLIVGGVGIALMPGEHLKVKRRTLVAGTLLSIVAALGGACGAVLSRKAYVIAHASGPPLDGANAAFQRVFGGLLIAGLCLLAVKRRAARLQPQPEGPARLHAGQPSEPARSKRLGVWPWVLVNSLAGQTLGVSCMQWALETTPTGIVLAIIAVTPIVVIPFALVFEGERPSLHSLVGGALAVAGVVGLTLA